MAPPRSEDLDFDQTLALLHRWTNQPVHVSIDTIENGQPTLEVATMAGTLHPAESIEQDEFAGDDFRFTFDEGRSAKFSLHRSRFIEAAYLPDFDMLYVDIGRADENGGITRALLVSIGGPRHEPNRNNGR
jgi:hypothetical protein